MDRLLTSLFEFLKIALADGEVAGVVALSIILFIGLVYCIYWLMKDRNRLIETLGKRDQSLKDLINKYEDSQLANVKAIHALKEVMIELKTIIQYRGSND